MSLAAVGEAIGVAEGSVSRYEKGRVPEPDVMQRIIAFTAGMVQPNDWFDLSAATPGDAAAGAPA